MPFSIETIPLGPLETNCHIIRMDGQCCIVDPDAWPESLLDFFHQAELVPIKILLTHGHADHISGVADIKKHYPECSMICPADDVFMLSDATANLSSMFGMNITAPQPDATCVGGDVIDCNGTELHVLDTSGHTPGGVSYYLPSLSSVMTGDSLFAEGIGRTDLPLADGRKLVKNIRENLLSLPDETRVFPGHGPNSTIGHEKMYNQFVVCP